MVAIGIEISAGAVKMPISMKVIRAVVRPEVVELIGQSTLPRPEILVVGIGGAGRHMVSQMPGNKLAIGQEGDAIVPGLNQVILRKSEVTVARTSSSAALHASDLPWKTRLAEAIGRPDVIFMFSGLGGETGSCISPLIAEMAHYGTTTFASVCLPFSVEGSGRRSLAKDGLSRLRSAAHMVAVYANDPLIKLAPNLPLGKAFGLMDQIMLSLPVEMCQCLTAEAIPQLKQGLGGKELRAGIGYGMGFEKERLAVEDAVSSPWFPSEDFAPETAFLLVTQSENDVESVRSCLEYAREALPAKRLLYTARVDPSLGRRLKASILLAYKF
jgi:cell division GTPase FtsZ